MPSQVRIISRRNSAEWDRLVRDTMNAGRYGVEHDYFGCASEQRADDVRKCIRTAGRRQGVGSRVYWQPCPGGEAGCTYGGPSCRYHVKYTLYPIDEARAYKAQQAKAPPGSPSGRR